MSLSLGGLVGGGLAGAGHAAGEVFQSQIDQANRLDYAQQLQTWEAQKQKLIDQNRVDLENQQRTAQAGRIGAAKTGLIDSAMADKYGTSDAAVASADAGQTDAPLTDEQRAVIQKGKASDRAALDNNDTYVKAAISTGDISPKDVMANTSKTEIAQLRADTQSAMWQNKYDTLAAMAADKNASFQERTQAQLQMQQMRNDAALDRERAKAERATNPKIDTATGRMMITSLDRDLGFHQSQISQLTNHLQDISSGPKGEAERAEVKARIEDHRSQIGDIMAQKKEYFKAMGTTGAPDVPERAPVDASKPDARVSAKIADDLKKDGVKSGMVNWNGAASQVTPNDKGGLDFAPPAANASAPTVITKEQFDKLPSGAVFTAPDGSRRVKP